MCGNFLKRVDKWKTVCYNCTIVSGTVITRNTERRIIVIALDLKSSRPIYEQIIEQVKLNVMKGYLKPGDSIPSVRRLALELKITPGTVAKAYQELERQEIIETIRGKGTFIAAEIRLEENEKRLKYVKKQLGSSIMELKMMGYDKNMIVDLIKGMYEEMCVC